MANVTHKGNPIRTVGELPEAGTIAPDFKLVKTNLEEVSLKDFKGKKIVLNIFLSIDTSPCSISVRKFYEKVQNLPNTVVLCISMDLPFAHKRFCSAEGLTDVIPLSAFRSPEFGKNYGVTMLDGPVAGIFSRAIVVIDESRKVLYNQQVPEVTTEVDYEKALAALET